MDIKLKEFKKVLILFLRSVATCSEICIKLIKRMKY